jgi:hypothetical protein
MLDRFRNFDSKQPLPTVAGESIPTLEIFQRLEISLALQRDATIVITMIH